MRRSVTSYVDHIINCAWHMRHFPMRGARTCTYTTMYVHTCNTWLPYFLSLMQKQNVFKEFSIPYILILSPLQI